METAPVIRFREHSISFHIMDITCASAVKHTHILFGLFFNEVCSLLDRISSILSDIDRKRMIVLHALYANIARAFNWIQFLSTIISYSLSGNVVTRSGRILCENHAPFKKKLLSLYNTIGFYFQNHYTQLRLARWESRLPIFTVIWYISFELNMGAPCVNPVCPTFTLR